jgi:hypothetical protein
MPNALTSPPGLCWMEAGLYLPLNSLSSDGKLQLDGLKRRALFVEPDAAKQSFFYGVNFEFSFNSKHSNGSREKNFR